LGVQAKPSEDREQPGGGGNKHFFYFSFIVPLGIEPRALHIYASPLTTVLHPQKNEFHVKECIFKKDFFLL
jgi:hypothetical protein